jgi:hypothetical protein
MCRPFGDRPGVCVNGSCAAGNCPAGLNACPGNTCRECCDGSQCPSRVCNPNGTCKPVCPTVNCTKRCLDTRTLVQGCKNQNGCDVEDVVSCDGMGGLGQCDPDVAACAPCGMDKCCDQRGDSCSPGLTCQICNSRALVFKNCVVTCMASVTPTGGCRCP